MDDFQGKMDALIVSDWVIQADQACERTLDPALAEFQLEISADIQRQNADLEDAARDLANVFVNGLRDLEAALSGQVAGPVKPLELFRLEIEIATIQSRNHTERMQREIDRRNLQFARIIKKRFDRLPNTFRPELAEDRQKREAEFARLPELIAKRDAMYDELGIPRPADLSTGRNVPRPPARPDR